MALASLEAVQKALKRLEKSREEGAELMPAGEDWLANIAYGIASGYIDPELGEKLLSAHGIVVGRPLGENVLG